MGHEAFAVDAADPRAPAQAVWDRMSVEERREVLASLPTEIPRKTLPEGDAHRIPKARALEALDEYFRRIGRRVYLGSELPVYYPDEAMFAPDLIAVVDVDPREREAWVVSDEGRGLDVVIEVLVSGERAKDLRRNVERLARLGIPEYFIYEPRKRRLSGHRLPAAGSKTYEPIVPQGGRWRSVLLDLDLVLDGGRLRFFHGSAPLLDAQELVSRLSAMVDDAVRRAEDEASRADDEAKRAEDEAKRADDEAKRAEDEAKRADRLAAKLRQLGLDPDALD
ncbi:MAG: Uma2 family endonuclease [Proteobacteria bacterium]|nr:Uma2 family endonuclease [Pseudomonadota bacterium]